MTGQLMVTGTRSHQMGLGSSAIGTLVERTTRFTMLLALAADGGSTALTLV